MKAGYINLIVLLALIAGVVLYRYKYRDYTSDFAKLEAGLSGIDKFFHQGSKIVLKNDLPDGGNTGSFANYLIAPAAIKKPGGTTDTILVLTTLLVTDSVTKALLASANTIWRYADDKYQMILVYNKPH